MHFSTSLLLACGTANLAFAATNVVFYAAYEGMNTNQGSKGCTGANLGTVKQSGAGESCNYLSLCTFYLDRILT